MKRECWTYLEATLVDADEVVVHVVVEDAIAYTELQILKEGSVVHDVEAVEDVEPRPVRYELLREEQSVLHHLRQIVHSRAVIVQIGNLFVNNKLVVCNEKDYLHS